MGADAAILFVDDEKSILNALKRTLRPTGYKIHVANSGKDGLDVLASNAIDVVVSDMRMPGMTGAEFLKATAEQWPETSRILLTGYSELDSAIAAVNEGAISRYLTKPWEDSDLRLCIQQAVETRQLGREKKRLELLTKKQNLELQNLNQDLEQKVLARTAEIKKKALELEQAHQQLKKGYSDAIEVFAKLVQSRSGFRSREFVATDARYIGEKMGLSDEQCESLYLAGLLCDIGLLSLRDRVVQTPYTDLQASDQRKFHEHPTTAAMTLSGLNALADAAEIIGQHCECYDGSGFPHKLKAEEILLGSRIVGLARSYEDLLNGRIFEEQMTPGEAKKFVNREAGKRFDPQITEIFVKYLESGKRVHDVPGEVKMLATRLTTGLKLTRDVLNENGTLVLAKGRVIEPKLLERMRGLEKAPGEPMEIYVTRY